MNDRYFLRVMDETGNLGTHEILDDEFDLDCLAYIARANDLLKLKKNSTVWVRFGNPRVAAELSEVYAKLVKMDDGEIVTIIDAEKISRLN
jgi:hypothetical protein